MTQRYSTFVYRNLEFVSFGQNEAAFSMILLFVVSYANKTGYNYDFFFFCII